MLRHFSHVFCDSMNCVRQASLSMRFSRQEYQSGLPCHPAEDLPNPGNESRCLSDSVSELSRATWKVGVQS